MGMNTNPYTITTTMGGGGGKLIYPLERAQDEKLVSEDKQKWDDLKTDEEKTNFLTDPGVTWGHNVPDENRNAYASRIRDAVAQNHNNEDSGTDVRKRILKQIHIGVFGAVRILLHAHYINDSLLKNLCESVDKRALNDTPSSVIWTTKTLDLPDGTTLDLVNYLNDAVERLNTTWNSGDVETKKTFVEYSLTLTDENLYTKDDVQILSKLIKARGEYTPAGQWNGLSGFIVCKSFVRPPRGA